MNKVAIVTGGTNGIGYGVATQLHDEGNVVYVFGVTDRTDEELQSEKFANFNYMKVDVSDNNQVKKAFKCIYEKEGKIDILVNSAGITNDKKIGFMTEKAWRDVIEVNLNGTFWTIKQASKFMLKNKDGVIVNLSSVVSHKTVVGQINYSSSKAAIEALTRTAALELSSYNIRVNSVSPGYIETGMLSSLSEVDNVIENIPLKRLGNVQEVSELICFLISDRAKYITGQNFVIDGGLSL